MKFSTKINVLIMAIAVIAIIFSLVIGCTAKTTGSTEAQDSYAKIAETGVVKVGYLMVLPPVAYLDENGEGQGYVHVLMDEVGKELGWKIEKVDVSSGNAIPALQAGEIDIDAGINAALPERAKSVIASRYPYLLAQQCLLGYTADEIKTWDDLVGKTLGVAKGTQGEIFATRKDLENKGVKIQRFDDDTLLNNALLAKQVDAITTIDLVAFPLIIDNPDLEIKFNYAKIGGHFMFRLNDTHLRDIMDTFIYEHYLNGDLATWWEETTGFPLGNFPGLYTKDLDYDQKLLAE